MVPEADWTDPPGALTEFKTAVQNIPGVRAFEETGAFKMYSHDW